MGLTTRNSRSLGALATWSRWGHSGEDPGWLLAGPGLEGASTQGNPRPGQPRRERADPCVSFRGRTVSGSHQRGATSTHFYRCVKHTLTYSVHFQLIHHRPTTFLPVCCLGDETPSTRPTRRTQVRGQRKGGRASTS